MNSRWKGAIFFLGNELKLTQHELILFFHVKKTHMETCMHTHLHSYTYIWLNPIIRECVKMFKKKTLRVKINALEIIVDDQTNYDSLSWINAANWIPGDVGCSSKDDSWDLWPLWNPKGYIMSKCAIC